MTQESSIMSFKSQFLRTLHERGFIHQQTDAEALDKTLHEGEQSGKPVVAYIGFDCTAESLHVGSLLQIMALRWFQQCGHKPIVLIGGGTTKIGDPSGKDESRKMLDDAAIEQNKIGIKKNFESFLTFEDTFDASTNHAVMVDNAEWIDKLPHVDFLQMARHFSVNRMLSMDSVKLRIDREQHLSLLEFLYMAHQAHDFTVLNEKYGCRLQLGGSDQWGNIVMGTDLHLKLWNEKHHGKKLNDAEDIRERNPSLADTIIHSTTLKRHLLFGLTTPLITTSSGAKMGKTAAGAVWLNPELLSPYDYWQFWRNTEDADVARFLKFFTDLPMDEIAKIEAMEGAQINEAKKHLATIATALLHGEDAAREAKRTAEETFELGQLGSNLPEILVSKAELETGIFAVKLFQLAGLAASGGEAKRLIQGGGARVNDEAVKAESQMITLLDMTEHGAIKLSAGKKKHVLVKVG
jgi:tyrosyl-tRNA synthetase